MQLKHILQGIGISISGAFLWITFYLGWMYEGKNEFLVVLICSFFGLLLSCVYTVPLGVALGFYLPSFCVRNSLGKSVLAAGILGVMVGAMTSLLVAMVFELELASVFYSMSAVCTVMIVGWTCVLWRGQPARAVPVAS